MSAAVGRRLFAIHDRIRLRYHTLKLRALIWVLRRQRAVDYRSIYREKEKQMETIPKKRLRRIGIRNDISLTIKPSSIIIPIAAYGSLAASAAVIICLSIQMFKDVLGKLA